MLSSAGRAATGMLAVMMIASGLVLAPTAAGARPVLLISIDGLRPGDVSDAAARGLKVPNLRRFLSEGSYAEGVIGILPTVTYPSHTTLITGAAPARHGIVNNLTFDPTQINREGWYWYASDIKVPTLWDAAHAAHLTTGNIHWPVSVGARAIDWNLPQIWLTGHDDDAKLLAVLATPGLLPELEASEGRYAAGIDDGISGDETRGRFAARLIGLHHPDFLTVYLTGLDTIQHHAGPDSPDAHAVLERLDTIVGNLVTAEQAAHPEAVVAAVSDHGFAPVTKGLNLWRAFLDAGLVRGEDRGPAHGGWQLTGWDAVPWISGGSIAVVLAHPQDGVLKAKVADLLARLKTDHANGIAGIIGRESIAQAGGNPQADFYLNLADGYMAIPWRGPEQPVVSDAAPYKGMHGYFPDDPRMRSTLLLMGAGVSKGHDLGIVDMRAIAPTLAAILDVKLAGAELPGLALDGR